MRRFSIRIRLMVMMILLTMLPVITVTWIATNNTRNSVEKEIISANISRMEWADQYLDEMIQQIDILFYTLQINQQLMDGLNNMDSQDIKVQYKTQNYIKDTLTSAFYTNSRKVDNLTLYVHSNSKTYSVDFANSGIISWLDIQKGSWSRMLQKPVSMYFRESNESIFAYHSINRFPDKKLLGGLSVRINNKAWEEVKNILKSESESSVFIMNDEGRVLSGSFQSDGYREIHTQLNSIMKTNTKSEFYTTKNYFYFMRKVGGGKLTIVKTIPVKTITQSSKATVTAGFLTGGLFAAISLLLSILLSVRISKPIVSLARSMSNVHIHNFELETVKGSIHSDDEIKLLETCYNSMIQRIKELIEEEYEREIELKNAQLMALQAQINPHFLNNTLQLIGGMSLKKNIPEIYGITRVLGDLLRYSISADGEMVSLEEELKHTRNYLFIQEQRFIGRCSIKVAVDPRVINCRVPKFILQPIVENAFEHGLQQKEGLWRVDIHVKFVKNKVAVLIKDNGVGISCERLIQIRSELKRSLNIKPDEAIDIPKKRRGVGLGNVDSRLKLQFGAKYRIRIFSKLSRGTIIALDLPINNGEVGEGV